ncbi:hydrogenase 1 maturation protease [Escherichia coli]
MSEQRVVVMGLGNLLWADEGFGVRGGGTAVCPLPLARVCGDCRWRYSGTELAGYVESASHLLILDAIDYGLEPGTLRTYAGERIPAYLSAKKMSLHQNSFSEVLALADIRGHLPAHIALVGLQPAMLDDYGGSLSELAGATARCGTGGAGAAGRVGIVPQPANESRCLNYDCLSMENYEGVRLRQYRMTQEEQG